MSLNYQQGEYTIGLGVQTFTVAFPVAFMSKPAVVLPVVVNEGATVVLGESKYLLSVNVGAFDANGFTVELSAPTNRADYKLAWVAGDFASVAHIVAQVKKLSQLPRRTRDLKSTDLVLVTDVIGNPVTETMTVADFFRTVVELVDAPTSSITPGTNRKIAIDDTYIHTYQGGAWKKVRRDSVTVIQPLPWRILTSSSAALAYDRIAADTTAAGFSVELPGMPVVGSTVEFADAAGTWADNPLTVTRNGQLVEGLAENLTCDVTDRFVLLFVGNAVGWKILA